MWRLRFTKRRFFQVSLRSALAGTAVLALLFALAGQTVRPYYHEQRALGQIPNLERSLPVTSARTTAVNWVSAIASKNWWQPNAAAPNQLAWTLIPPRRFAIPVYL